MKRAHGLTLFFFSLLLGMGNVTFAQDDTIDSDQYGDHGIVTVPFVAKQTYTIKLIGQDHLGAQHKWGYCSYFITDCYGSFIWVDSNFETVQILGYDDNSTPNTTTLDAEFEGEKITITNPNSTNLQPGEYSLRLLVRIIGPNTYEITKHYFFIVE